MARVKALTHLLEGLAPGQVGEVSDERAEHLVETGAAEYIDDPKPRRAACKPKTTKKK